MIKFNIDFWDIIKIKFEMKSLILKLCLIFIASVGLFAQAPDDKFINIELMDNKDTLIVHRSYGDWWYGLRFGANGSVDFGDLNLWRFPTQMENPFNRLLSHSGDGGNGLGYYIGLTGEWVRPNKTFGYALSVNLLDVRNVTSNTGIIDTTFQTRYEFESKIKYLSISPAVKYYLGIGGLHLLWGLDFDIHLDDESRQWKRFINSGAIEEKTIVKLNEFNFRAGVNLGAGWDIFMADIRGKTTVRFTPFASVHLGTSMISDNNSSFNSIYARIGLAVKFGPNELEYDTLTFDPNHVPQYGDIVSARINYPFGFSGFEPNQVELLGDLAMVYNPNIFSEATGKEPEFKQAEKPKDIATTTTPTTQTTPNQTPPKKITIKPNELKRFSFPRTDVTNLTTEMKEYLDAVAEFVRTNPGHGVRIVGHSDNQGTPQQQLQRGQARTRAGVRYLRDKNVKSILDVEDSSSLFPIKENTTEQGRKANRRLEITVYKR